MKENSPQWLHALAGITLLAISFSFMTPIFWQSMFQILKVIAYVMTSTDSLILNILVIMFFVFGSIGLYFALLYQSYVVGTKLSQRM